MAYDLRKCRVSKLFRLSYCFILKLRELEEFEPRQFPTQSALLNSTTHALHLLHSSQTSADAYNVGSFQLPNPAGKAGGACTSALLQVLYRDGQVAGEMSWVQVLRAMRANLRNMGYDQIPQLTR